MNTHNKMLLRKIQEFCKEYRERKIDLAELQSSVEAVHSNFESDMDIKLTDKIFYFVEELEGIRFMHAEDEHFKLVVEKINTLDNLIESVLNAG